MMRNSLLALGATIVLLSAFSSAQAVEATNPATTAPVKASPPPAASPAPAPAIGIASPIGSAAPSFAREPDAAAAPSTPSIACPKELRNLVSIDDPSAKDWIVGGTDQTTPLKGGRVFAGPPNEKTIERYNELTAIPFMNRDKGEFQQVWTFDDKLLQAGVMIVCDYSGNNHMLMRAVPVGTKECKEVVPIDKSDSSTTIVICQ